MPHVRRESLDGFIERVPKAEMHLHLEGAVRWETVRELHPDGADLPDTPPWLAGDGKFSDFNDFRDAFENYIRPSTGTPEAIERHVREVLGDLAAQNVRYVEATVGPPFHINKGMSIEAVLEAMGKGREAAEAHTGIVSRFILGVNRHGWTDERLAGLLQTIDVGGPRGMGLLAGIDLQGDERVGPPEDFVAVFDYARRRGMRVKAHAGELGGPKIIRATLDALKVEHISHGVRAVEDPELVREIAQRGTYLHVCPTSNVRLGVADSYGAHPLRRLFDAGCRVTVNSDDPILFGVTVTDEYRNAARKMGFSAEELARMVRTAFESSLLDPAERDAFCAQVDEALKTA